MAKFYTQFYNCIGDLISNPKVRSMRQIPHHVNVNCLEHSIYVAYLSFRISRFFGLDFTASARGGLLHDLFLYNWRTSNNHKKYHLFSHPSAALNNALTICDLSDKEKDIIVKHMWPLTPRPPRYKETFVVSCADKICAVMEMMFIYRFSKLRRKIILSALA